MAVASLSALARRLSLPYPIVLVVGGAVLGFAPGLPEVTDTGGQSLLPFSAALFVAAGVLALLVVRRVR